MKVSSVAVLLSVTSASAFNVSYLNQLGGPSAPAKAAPAVQQQVVNSGPASYLDRLTGGPELVSAMQSAPAPVAPAAPAPVAPVAGAAPAAGDYLSALTSISRASGAGLTGYLDALPSVAAPTAGAGMTTYLDSMSGSAPAPVAPAAPAAAAAPVAYAAPVVAAAAPAAGVAAAAGDYLSTLRTAGAVSGAGLMTHLDTLTVNTNSGTGVALSGYLAHLHTNAALASGAGIITHVDALGSNSAIAGSGVVAPSAPSASSVPGVPSGGFLHKIFQQLSQLTPSDVAQSGGQLQQSGQDITFAAASAQGNMAMTFVKKGN